MGIYQASKYCKNCQRKTLHEHRSFDSKWGCLLSLLTCGLFLPIWILMSIAGSLHAYRCQTCGRKRIWG